MTKAQTPFLVVNPKSYLYGEKMKAYLIKGARRLPAMRDYPNPVFGDNGIIVSS